MGNITPTFKNLGSFDVNLVFEILEYTNFFDQSSVLLIGNQAVKDVLLTDISFKWRLDQLHHQRGIYSPLVRVDGSLSFKDMFVNFYARRDLWNAPDAANAEEKEGGVGGGEGEDMEDLPLWRMPKKVRA